MKTADMLVLAGLGVAVYFVAQAVRAKNAPAPNPSATPGNLPALPAAPNPNLDMGGPDFGVKDPTGGWA